MQIVLIIVAVIFAIYLVFKKFTGSSLEVSDKGELGGQMERSLDMVTDRKEQITPHFKATEFVCPDGCSDFKISRLLVERLEAFRPMLEQLTGFEHPINVLSGYRCPKHNTTVGGATNSFHMKGCAADISVPGMAAIDLHKLLYVAWYTAKAGGLGFYDWGAHVDLGPVRKWDKRSTQAPIA
jgi:uncharacterized protein YcbK (DUF882 family)